MDVELDVLVRVHDLLEGELPLLAVLEHDGVLVLQEGDDLAGDAVVWADQTAPSKLGHLAAPVDQVAVGYGAPHALTGEPPRRR